MTATTLVWFRRDLRLDDHSALMAAMRAGRPLVGVFVFDRHILDPLPPDDRRLTFICQCLDDLAAQLAELGMPLHTVHGLPEEVLPELAARCGAAEVVCAEDYEPAAIDRDNRVGARLMAQNCRLLSVCDQVLLPKSTVMNKQGRPYTVFTPYKKAWLALYADIYAGWQPVDIRADVAALQRGLPEHLRQAAAPLRPADLGFADSVLIQAGGERAAQAAWQRFLPRLGDYAVLRDFPARKGTSGLSPHLRFGTLSVRRLAAAAYADGSEGASVWLSELIWREFFQQFLYHHPEAAEQGFRPEYRALAWENRADDIEAWQAGQTGYPLIDAAMRHLRRSGQMHNRLRMVCASFFCKDLLCDWRIGEAWFARQLLDFDLAANNGGWQWAAGTGCDAQPYFRHFNPLTQSQKFDPEGQFIRRHVPELAHLDARSIHAPWLWADNIDTHGYPPPIVQHARQRERALALYARAQEEWKKGAGKD
ncbi:deoxyribodipyrimidine photo-lyase [Neisseria shayeganii]|uniref:Deoxyribodipyrimidine photo-lyase n=2 Tax=Neisseria shayeganii TaxID=607712 RepID=A0A7D7S9H9_9NEIS|nr:deoxyribodipyrimidine photo-lyase [Neisseria shayeganii]QMT41591.1 deoxyribodipyrimidine photo-lyase [Neisseria shayeganii]